MTFVLPCILDESIRHELMHNKLCITIICTCIYYTDNFSMSAEVMYLMY